MSEFGPELGCCLSHWAGSGKIHMRYIIFILAAEAERPSNVTYDGGLITVGVY